MFRVRLERALPTCGEQPVLPVPPVPMALAPTAVPMPAVTMPGRRHLPAPIRMLISVVFQTLTKFLFFRPYYSEMNDGVRRKNATRESTNTLKAWLNEHKKNPYPTKGEKIMLAIITKMTLTQV